MGLREELGGKVEDALNKAVDEHLSAEKLGPMIGAAVDKLLGEQMEKLKHKLKADIIDKIDGQDDIK